MQGLQNSTLFREACYINGDWVKAHDGSSIDVINPADAKMIGTIPNCGAEETKQAIDAAYAAFAEWRQHSAKERAQLLFKWALLIDDNKEDLARMMTIEQGKPIAESRGEIDYGNGFIKWYAEEARRVYGDILPSNKRDQHLLVLKQPVGVAAMITPWNFPNAMIARKVSAALAAGCTTVIKPASETPYSAFAMAVLAAEAGIPKGVINIITGDSDAIGGELTSNELVRKLSFTGSTAVGRLLMKECAPTIKKLSLELGGNAPFIVFDDADIDAAVEGALAAKYRNTGQTCVSANRIYVQENVYDAFADKLAAAAKNLRVGNGLEDGVQQGPLINEAALKKVQEHISDAEKKGARILVGGKSHQLGGLFFEPTVLAGVDSSMLMTNEETFGPVAPLYKFKDEDDVIAKANHTIFGLAAYFYSNNVHRIFRVAEALEYGMVGVNAGIISTEVAPFGGVKQSGIGREGSRYGIEDYIELKYVCLQQL